MFATTMHREMTLQTQRLLSAGDTSAELTPSADEKEDYVVAAQMIALRFQRESPSVGFEQGNIRARDDGRIIS